jgi:single-stranded DNA-binding protein
MNSFKMTAVGILARNPELVALGEVYQTRFCLVGNDYVGGDEEDTEMEIVTSLWFVAFGAIGEAIAAGVQKGDQLICEARIRSNNWTDKHGEKRYENHFVVTGFRFGARKGGGGSPVAQRNPLPPASGETATAVAAK